MKLRFFLVNCDGEKIISQLDEKKYPVEFKREVEDGRDFFLTRQHCKIEKYKGFYVPAFKILLNDGDEPANYSLAISADRNDTEPEKLTQGGDLFFHHYKNNHVSFDDDKIKDLGFEPGVSYIFILKNGKVFGEPYKIFVIPSSMTEKEFSAMINEMLYIRSELVSRNTKTAVGLPIELKKDSKKFFRYLQEKIDELCKVMRKINLNPRKKLSKILMTCKAKKIRKFDSKIMRQYLTNPQRKNYLVDSDEVSLNIFENRLLLNKLQELQKKIADNAQINNNNFISEQESILRKISDELSIKFDDTERAREYLSKKYTELENRLSFLRKKITDSLKIKPTTINIRENEIAINFRQMSLSKVDFQNGVSITLEPVWADYSNSGKNFSGATFSFANDETKYYWDELILFTSNIRWQVTLADFILKNSSDLNTTISLTGQFIIENGRYSNSKIIKICSIKNMKLDGKTFPKSEEETVQFLQDISLNYENLEIEQQKIKNLEIDITTNIDNIENNIQSENISEKLTEILQLPIFDTVEKKIEHWRMTQIFTNDANYHKAYKILKHLDDILNFSFQADKKTILAKNLDKIYEYWILAKIIEHLVLKLNFKVDGGDDFIKIFNNFFDKRKENLAACINLSRQDIKMKIFYDMQICEIFKNTTDRWRPDFLFMVSKKNSASQLFILDAKYRNYESMRKNYWLNEDLRGVCLEKYIYEIYNAIHKKVTMSFIVHSDKIHDNTNYLGKYVVYNGTADSRCKSLTDDKKIISDGSRQQFGSFYLLPNTGDGSINQSEENLTLFFKLMFEYFLDDWKENCWHCGVDSNDIYVKELSTAGGYKKYHMTCKNCGAFWVKNHCVDCYEKLIKHLTNYHVDVDKGRWYVICPKCGNQHTCQFV